MANRAIPIVLKLLIDMILVSKQIALDMDREFAGLHRQVLREWVPRTLE